MHYRFYERRVVGLTFELGGDSVHVLLTSLVSHVEPVLSYGVDIQDKLERLQQTLHILALNVRAEASGRRATHRVLKPEHTQVSVPKSPSAILYTGSSCEATGKKVTHQALKLEHTQMSKVSQPSCILVLNVGEAMGLHTGY